MRYREAEMLENEYNANTVLEEERVLDFGDRYRISKMPGYTYLYHVLDSKGRELKYGDYDQCVDYIRSMEGYDEYVKAKREQRRSKVNVTFSSKGVQLATYAAMAVASAILLDLLPGDLPFSVGILAWMLFLGGTGVLIFLGLVWMYINFGGDTSDDD